MTCPNLNTVTPADHNLTSWSYDPALAISATSPTAGTVYLCGVYLRRPARLSTVWFHVGAVAVTPTTGQNFLGLYTTAGTLLGSTADISTQITAIGLYGVPLTAPVNVPAGLYWVAFVLNAATTPQIARAAGIAAVSALINANLSPARYRWAINGTAATALPASITPATNSNTGTVPFWVAVS